jgi:hypothetical protein
MKQIFHFSVSCLIILFLAGCNSKRNAVEVIVDGNGQFPESLAGLWRSDNNAWEIELEPDGKIAWAIISLGSVKIEPGMITAVPMRLGGKGIFKAGRWAVWYLQKQREITIEISIDYFRTELGQDVIHGKTRDIFSGPVSQDGKLWWAERYSYPQYIVDTSTYHEYKLPVDPNENPKESLLFRKIPEPVN